MIYDKIFICFAFTLVFMPVAQASCDFRVSPDGEVILKSVPGMKAETLKIQILNLDREQLFFINLTPELGNNCEIVVLPWYEVGRDKLADFFISCTIPENKTTGYATIIANTGCMKSVDITLDPDVGPLQHVAILLKHGAEDPYGLLMYDRGIFLPLWVWIAIIAVVGGVLWKL